MFKLDDYYGGIIPLTEENPIKNGWLLPDGQFFICCFGGHSELLKNLVEEQVVERGAFQLRQGIATKQVMCLHGWMLITPCKQS